MPGTTFTEDQRVDLEAAVRVAFPGCEVGASRFDCNWGLGAAVRFPDGRRFGALVRDGDSEDVGPRIVARLASAIKAAMWQEGGN